MIRIISLFLLLVVGAVSFSAYAADSLRHFVLDNTKIIPIKSKHTGRDHEIIIVFPASYGSDPNKTYPVFYYLDAYWDTPLLVSTYGNLIYDNEVPEFLMVGLSYPQGKNYGEERRIDYTVTPQEGVPSGGADKFLAFIQTEVAPLIEAQYRGEKTGRILGGVSLGGLFTLMAAYRSPEFFSGYIAISPAAGWDNEVLFKIDEAYRKQNKSLNARMFISHGTKEYAPFRKPIEKFQKHLSKRKYKGLELQNYVMKDLDHVSVKGDGYVRGLIWVWKPQKPSGPAGLEREMNPKAK